MAETRAQKILSVAARHPECAELALEAVRSGQSHSDFLGDALRLMSPNRPRVEVVRCHDSKWRDATTDLVVMQACGGRIPGRISDGERARREAAAYEAGSSLHASDGTLLRSIGEATLKGPKDRFGNRDLESRMMGVSDLPQIAGDAFSRILFGHFDEQPRNWEPISRIRNAPDFKALVSVKMGDSASLIETGEGVPVPQGALVDSKESYSIKEYARQAQLSRQLLLNSGDLGPIGAIAQSHAVAAMRTINDVVFSLLTSASGVGPTMAEDTKALFAVDHTSGANYIASTGAPDAAGVNALGALMRKAKGFCATTETAPTMNVTPAILLVPGALAGTAMNTVSNFANVQSGSHPAFERGLSLLVEPRLDAGTNGATAWYLVANPATTPGLEVAFLGGRARPTVQRMDEGNPLGMSFSVILDVGAKFTEHRSWARTKGA